MLRTSAGIVTGLALLIGLAGCTDGTTPTDLTAPELESRSVSASGALVLEGLQQGQGDPTVMHGWQLNSRIRGGIAPNTPEQPTTMAQVPSALMGRALAVRDRGERPTTQHYEWEDAEGRTHSVEMVRAGQRTLSIDMHIDGERVATLSREWKQERGYWVVAEAKLTQYQGGRAIARFTASADQFSLGSRGIAAVFQATQGAASVLQRLGPAPLHASESCWRETAALGLASAGVVLSCGSATPACVVAVAAYVMAIEALADCKNVSPI